MFLSSGALIVRRYSEVCAVAQLLTPFPGEAVRCLRIKGLILEILRKRVVSYSAERNRREAPQFSWREGALPRGLEQRWRGREVAALLMSFQFVFECSQGLMQFYTKR